MDLTSSKLFITGASGSFGSAFIKHLIETNNLPQKLTIFSRDWHKQRELRNLIIPILENMPKKPIYFTDKIDGGINWVIGDIRDKERLANSIQGHDIVIHAAAIKCIEACENNPVECLKTNVIGTQNVIDAVKTIRTNNSIMAIFISTDKAVLPINTYGTSKKMAEKLWINANKSVYHRFSICRYGNVIGSSGSVLPLFIKLIKDNATKLPVTHEKMTRFWYPMKNAINFVLDSLVKMVGGEVFIPKIPSIYITDLCKALNRPYYIIGMRPGEKLHESMVAPDDITGNKGYSSGNNIDFLTVEEIRESIKDFTC